MNTLNHDVNLPEDIDTFSESFLHDLVTWPTISRIGAEVYIIKENKILCTARIGSAYQDVVRVYLDTDEGLEALKDDYAVKILGKHAPFPFSEYTGWYELGLTNDDDSSRIGLTIVDKRDFDIGIASKLRYSHIPGFGALLWKVK